MFKWSTFFEFIAEAPQSSDESDANDKSTLRKLVTELKDVLHKIHEERHTSAMPINEDDYLR